MRILIIEDDAEMREALKVNLQSESYVVDCASDGKNGSYMARTNDYDVIILDSMLPHKSGYEVCTDIREMGKSTPILLLSVKTEIDEKTKLLDIGVDDYMTKPYSHKELLSRIKALTRRPQNIKPTLMQIHNIVLDSTNYEVRKDGKRISLTTKEFSLFELLLANRGKTVTRGVILEHVWDITGDPLSKTVETHMLNLRKKIEKGRKKIIQNIPGRGYRID